MSESNAFNNAKNSLLRYYSSQQTSQGTRLIGFTVGLFTLLQTVQYAQEVSLSKVFPDLTECIRIIEVCAWLGESVKFSLLFLAIFILLTWTVRTIFRFLVYAYFAERLMKVTQEGIGEPMHSTIHSTITEKLDEENVKAYWFFPLTWFFRRKDKLKGWICCLFLAGLCTLILLWFLW